MNLLYETNMHQLSTDRECQPSLSLEVLTYSYLQYTDFNAMLNLHCYFFFLSVTYFAEPFFVSLDFIRVLLLLLYIIVTYNKI